MSRIMFRFWLDDTKQNENELIEQVEELKQTRSFTSTIRNGIRLVNSLTSGSLDVLFELFPFVRAEFLNYVQEQISTDTSAQNDALRQRIIELESDNATLRERNQTLQNEITEDNKIIEAQDKELSILRKKHEKPSQDNSALEAKIDRLENLIISNGYRPENSTEQAEIGPKSGSIGIHGIETSNGGGVGKSLNVPQFSVPTFDDEDDDIVLEIKRDTTSGDKAVANFLKSMQALQAGT